MDMSPEGLAELIKHEGMKFNAYKDIAGVWTICVGHTSAAGPPKVRPGMTATLDQCMEMLKHDVSKYEDAVELAVKKPMTQHQFDAMVSLCYNIGPAAFRKSSVLRHFNAGDTLRAADSFLLWNKARVGGKLKVVRGLVNRRERERDMFLGRATA
jgi:lysozyme